jgi:hypothetical protein
LAEASRRTPYGSDTPAAIGPRANAADWDVAADFTAFYREAVPTPVGFLAFLGASLTDAQDCVQDARTPVTRTRAESLLPCCATEPSV